MKKLLWINVLLLMIASCGNPHFISDADYRQKVEKHFKERKDFAKNRSAQLFDIFHKKDLNLKEKEALMFLYAYMPLCDLAVYDGSLFLNQVRYSFKAKETFSWGKTIPEDVFRNFVLPYRVNNENLDTARIVFFNELKDRILNLSMKEAALEVNHWCHEKVNYAPTDIRTSSPLNTVKNSFGRCGEESTFTVTALRSVGIPARQVYTPRWAHSDDNHAWVEVWVDGKWYFMGACEPEPDLNMAWFTEPARRAMLVHTKVFGNYKSKDEVTKKSKNFSEINVIDNYAEVKTFYVKVVDKEGKAIENAQVDFGLYNYAEFYPIASIFTNKRGISKLTTGLGDLLIWVSKDGEYAYKKVSVKHEDSLNIELGNQEFIDVEYAVYHPPIKKQPYKIDQSKKKANKILLAKEDSIRRAYKNTFMKNLDLEKFALAHDLNKDKCLANLKLSEGNWNEIMRFMQDLKDKEKTLGFALLSEISHKDLRDTKASILRDHLSVVMNHYFEQSSEKPELFSQYVLNPRIKNENLKAYRNLLYDAFHSFISKNSFKTVLKIKDWIKKNIQINEDENYYNLPINPKGVYELKISNIESRDIFFIAILRSLGIPSRLEPTNKRPQYYNGSQWMYVSFEEEKEVYSPAMGSISFDKKLVKKGFDPVYRTHFSLAKLNNGVYETLDFGWGEKLSAMEAIIPLEIGQYRLMTAIRDKDGSVSTKIINFIVKDNMHQKIPLVFVEQNKERKPIGTIDIYQSLIHKQETVNLKSLFKKDYALFIWIEPGKEPSRHLMEEFKNYKEQYENWGGEIVIIKASDIPEEGFTGKYLESLPNNYGLYQDKNDALMNVLKKNLKIEGKSTFPLIIVLDKEGKIYLESMGYKIGIHEQILKLIIE